MTIRIGKQSSIRLGAQGSSSRPTQSVTVLGSPRPSSRMSATQTQKARSGRARSRCTSCVRVQS